MEMLFVLVLSIAFGIEYARPINSTTEDLIDTAVTSCCVVHHTNCCRRSVTLNEPINCSKKQNEHENENNKMIECIFAKLHPQEPSMIGG